MNTKVKFRSTKNYDEGLPYCGFGEPWDYLVAIFGEGYDMGEYLKDREIDFEQNEKNPDYYFVLDEQGKRTGEAYWVTDTEPTDRAPCDWDEYQALDDEW